MIEHLKSLAEQLRYVWDNALSSEFIERGTLYTNLETELVRVEDYLSDLKETDCSREVFFVAVRPKANMIYQGRIFYDEKHALGYCEAFNEHCQTPDHWKVYRGTISIDKEEVVNEDTAR